jgi:predicted 2-oxoglutarate/Fe(II)-dependent dioxygenase YbiX
MKKISDFIYVKKILEENFCDEIVNQITENKNWEPHIWSSPDGKLSSKYDEASEEYEELEVLFASAKTEKIAQKLFPILVNCCKEYSSTHSFSEACIVNQVFPPRYNRYKENTRMHMHYDHIHSLFTPPVQGIPTLTILGILNDDYEGGEFILFDDYQIETKKGDIIIFPSNFMYPHEVKKVTKGIRYSLVSWAC